MSSEYSDVGAYTRMILIVYQVFSISLTNIALGDISLLFMILMEIQNVEWSEPFVRTFAYQKY